jgi:hydrogenase-4 component F
MIVCLLLLTVVFASFFKVIAAAVFGAKPENIIPGEFNWLTLAPAVVLIALMLMLGLYIPPQLSSLLQGATNVVLTGETAQLSTSVWQGLPVLANLRAFLLPLSNLLH